MCVPEIRRMFQTSFRPSGRVHARAGIQENQTLLDARFREHDGGDATDFFWLVNSLEAKNSELKTVNAHMRVLVRS